MVCKHKKYDLTHEALLEFLEYNPESGLFYWKKSRSKGRQGEVAGGPTPCGYVRIKLYGYFYQAHILAWFYINKRWPIDIIDHINGHRSDNRIENLREATKLLNSRNSKLSKANTSGVKGVHWDTQKQRWSAIIKNKGKQIHIGKFTDLELAELAISEARSIYHKEFSRDK